MHWPIIAIAFFFAVSSYVLAIAFCGEDPKLDAMIIGGLAIALFGILAAMAFEFWPS